MTMIMYCQMCGTVKNKGCHGVLLLALIQWRCCLLDTIFLYAVFPKKPWPDTCYYGNTIADTEPYFVCIVTHCSIHNKATSENNGLILCSIKYKLIINITPEFSKRWRNSIKGSFHLHDLLKNLRHNVLVLTTTLM